MPKPPSGQNGRYRWPPGPSPELRIPASTGQPVFRGRRLDHRHDGTAFTIGAGWVLPPAYPNFSATWIEFVGTEGAVMVDDTHRDVYSTTMKNGIQFPISSMPGEKVNHVYAGPMEAETLHFFECVALGKQPLVTGEQARLVMQVYRAADLSAETGQPVDHATESRPAPEPSFA